MTTAPDGGPVPTTERAWTKEPWPGKTEQHMEILGAVHINHGADRTDHNCPMGFIGLSWIDYARARTCVNACAPFDDPATAIPAMVEEMRYVAGMLTCGAFHMTDKEHMRTEADKLGERLNCALRLAGVKP